MAIIVGTVFNSLGQSADYVSKRTILLFFAILINAFMSAAEVMLSLLKSKLFADKPSRS